MLEVWQKAFPEILNSEEVKSRLNEIIPFWNKEVTEEFFKKQLKKAEKSLQLK